MTDIVKSLRCTLTDHATDDEMWERVIREREEAADEITRLRAENERLRAEAKRYAALAIDNAKDTDRAMKLLEAADRVVVAYDQAQPFRSADMHRADCQCLRCAIDIARAALEAKHD